MRHTIMSNRGLLGPILDHVFIHAIAIPVPVTSGSDSRASRSKIELD